MAQLNQKAPKGHQHPSSSSNITDPRFAPLQTDPRYRLPSRKQTHVKLDKRFASILRDDEFSRKASVDRYGRKIESGAGRRELERLYRLESDEEDEDEDEGDDDAEIRKELMSVKAREKRRDPAREGGFSESSSDEEESEEEEAEGVEEAELFPTEVQGAEVPMGEVSKRIAVVNMDWDNIRAADIFAAARSFVSEGGQVESVVVYPSEFGRERMEREELEGPPAEIFARPNVKAGAKSTLELEDDSDEDDERIKKQLLQEDKGEEFNSTALRRYQLDRLRYYYAVITCSSEAAARALYNAMDGREYLSSANFFDLRFVPDEVEFDERPRDSCEHVPEGYRPTDFVTNALTHSNVKLTWDADDGKRKEVQKRAFSRKEIDENDLQAYIGSASSSEEDEEEILPVDVNPIDADAFSTMSKPSRADRRDALRAALGLPPEPERRAKGKRDRGPVGDMQISFTPGISASNGKGSVFENEPLREESTREKYIRKERERKARRKERAKARREGQDPEAEPANENEAEDQGSEAGSAIAGAEADPFDDPFFDEPASASLKASRRARKEEKAKLRKERAAEEAANKANRAELELMMLDEDQVKHFDMKDIAKAEKLKKKKKHKGKRADDSADMEASDNGFQMDVNDPRFSKLFENHEFAIDPTNPRFKGTKGMKALLEEGRRKRKLAKDEEGNVELRERKKTKAKERHVGNGGQDVSSLVEKFKKRSKQ